QAQQANVTLAVATAANEPNIDYVLGGLNLRHYFATVVGADDVARGKPEPDLFLLVAERLHLVPETCLVFEDSLAGGSGAPGGDAGRSHHHLPRARGNGATAVCLPGH